MSSFHFAPPSLERTHDVEKPEMPVTKDNTGQDESAKKSNLAKPKMMDSFAKGDLTEHHISMTFPQRMMEILDDPSNSNVISWLPNGKGFTIHKKWKFVNEIIPKYFPKQAKFPSFLRKLNRWGFTHVDRGKAAGTWWHPSFKRGDMHSCMQMTCQSSHTKSIATMANTIMQQQALMTMQQQQQQALAGAALTNPNIAMEVLTGAAAPRLDPAELQQLLHMQQMQIQQLQQKQNLQKAELLRAAHSASGASDWNNFYLLSNNNNNKMAAAGSAQQSFLMASNQALAAVNNARHFMGGGSGGAARNTTSPTGVKRASAA